MKETNGTEQTDRQTEHGFHADCAQDEIVEVDLTMLVAVPHHQTLERRVTHQKTWHNAMDVKTTFLMTVKIVATHGTILWNAKVFFIQRLQTFFFKILVTFYVFDVLFKS